MSYLVLGALVFIVAVLVVNYNVEPIFDENFANNDMYNPDDFWV